LNDHATNVPDVRPEQVGNVVRRTAAVLLNEILDALDTARDLHVNDAENWELPLTHAAGLVDALAALLNVRLDERR
jgi:hypothetical protein